MKIFVTKKKDNKSTRHNVYKMHTWNDIDKFVFLLKKK